MSGDALGAFGRWIAETPGAWPEAALESAHRALIDTVAVMIPGSTAAGTRKVAATVAAWGEGPCTVVGSPRPLAAPWAALINGTAGHALDFDDNFDPPKAHASTVLFPAVLALGETQHCSALDCLDAYIVGLQIQGRVGQGLNPPHRNRGWHATATTGALGAAAAGARLLGLDAERSAAALSIATSMAAGFMSQFGTETKPLHAGLAAKAGVMAASLARAGLTAGTDTLEGATGMAGLMVGPDRDALRRAIVEPEHGQTLTFETDGVGDPLLILEHGFRVKRFPNCGSAHRAMDGLQALRQEHGFAAQQVSRVEVRAPAVHLNNLMYRRPETGLQGKFSLEYALACILLDGDCSLVDFSDAAVRRASHRQLYPRLHRHPVDKPESECPTEVCVTLGDGRALRRLVDMPLGSKAAPFSLAQHWAKLRQCSAALLGEARHETLRQALAELRSAPRITDFTRLLAVELAEPEAAAPDGG